MFCACYLGTMGGERYAEETSRAVCAPFVAVAGRPPRELKGGCRPLGSDKPEARFRKVTAGDSERRDASELCCEALDGATL